MVLGEINFLAVVVGAIAAFLLGWLVYSPLLFGHKWAIGSGVSLNSGKPPVFAMVAQMLALLLLSLVVGATATADALGVAVLAILAAAFFSMSNGAFINKSTYAVRVDGGYIIAAGAVMIAVQALL